MRWGWKVGWTEVVGSHHPEVGGMTPKNQMNPTEQRFQVRLTLRWHLQMALQVPMAFS